MVMPPSPGWRGGERGDLELPSLLSREEGNPEGMCLGVTQVTPKVGKVCEVGWFRTISYTESRSLNTERESSKSIPPLPP